MYSLFLFRKTSILTLSGSKQVRVGAITFPAQLKTRSDSADVGGMDKSFLVRGARLGKWTPKL